MRIQLNRNYSGPRINDLPPGEYDENDERLCGRASYLVGIEVAVWVEEDAPLEDETAEAAAPKPAKKGKVKS